MILQLYNKNAQLRAFLKEDKEEIEIPYIMPNFIKSFNNLTLIEIYTNI